MKTRRGFLAVMFSACAMLALLALFQPARSAGASPAAAALDVVVNEVAWGGTAAGSADEWIELKNNTAVAINLNGWVLRSLTDNSPSIILTGTIAPGGYYLLERSDNNTVSDIPADQAPYLGDLGNGGESLQLTDASSNVIDTANGNGGAWPAGSGSPGYYSMERINSLTPDADLNWAPNDGVTRNGLDASGDPLNGTPHQPNSARFYVPAAPGSVLLSAVHFDGYAASDGDEGFRLTNVSTRPVTLTNMVAINGGSEINLTGTLQPGQSIWVAKTAIGFTQQFGHKPAYKYTADADASVPLLTMRAGSPPALGPGDALAVREGANNWMDAVVWTSGSSVGEITDTGWLAGWIGSNVQRYSDGDVSASGQILYRKLDEATGKIVADTNTARDWANDRTDPISGRKALFPGWDLEKFRQTAKVTGRATLMVAIAPDNAYRVISDVLGAARSSVKLEMHSFDNLGLLDVVTKTIRRGVRVTILMEGGPAGGIDNQERWVCQQIEAAGGQCWFMITNTSGGNTIHARYDYLHAKMFIVDDRVVGIGSENFSPRSLTYDDPADGTRGHRGVYLVTDASGIVSRALEIWTADFDPVNHRDIFRWSPVLTGTYGPPPPGFTPNYSVEVGGYSIRYPLPLTVTAPLTFELLTAPESALRVSDSLLGLINRSGAGDAIDVEQLDEPPHWGASTSNPIADPNLRLEALIAAARRGVKVRLLLDRFFDDAALPTSNAATVQYVESLRAVSPTLRANLEVRLGDPALYGLHSKLFLFDIGGRKMVHAGSLNGTETANKANREVALQVESGAAYAYLRNMFEYDWAFQPRVRLPLVVRDYFAPPHHLLISKVFYLGSISPITGSEWAQIYNPTGITVSLSGYKLGDQAAPGPTGFTVDGMWQFPPNASVAPGGVINVATTAQGFFNKYGRYPDYVFFGAGLRMIPYSAYTPNVSFSLANTGDEVLLLGPNDQLVDGVAWGTGSLPGHVSCLAIPSQNPNPSIKREPLWRDTNNCPNDFVIDPSATP
jgi:phosphatidylserine/phosphatidylglycerophosphate/cardiolipin synthase-like enzyme